VSLHRRSSGSVPRSPAFRAASPRIRGLPVRAASETLQGMPLINLVISLVVVGLLLWLVNNFIPMDSKIKSILNIVVVVAVVLWLLSAFGVLGPLSSYQIGS
jgi:hypothetical protein